MNLLVPVVLLLLAVLAILILGLLKLRIGTIWLVAAVASFGAWISIILIVIFKPASVIISNWLPEPFAFHSLILSSSPQQWGIGFLLVSLLVAVVFSEAKYLATPDYFLRLTGAMLLTAFGLLAIFSRSLLAFVLTWSLVDLVEFGVIAVLIGRPKSHQSATISVLFRALGILLLILLVSYAPPDPSTGVPTMLTNRTWWLLILLVLFRMGTIPQYQPYIDTPVYQRGLISLIRSLPILTTFSFVAFMAPVGLPVIRTGFIFTLLTVAILYASIAWFSAMDEIKGRPHWLFAMAGYGLATLLTGEIDALTGLAVVLITGGSGLFLYSPRLKRINPFIVLLLMSLLTIPYTPSAGLSRLFSSSAAMSFRIVWVVSYAILVAGIIKHALKRAVKISDSEPWMLLFHTIALYFIALAPWVIILVFLGNQPDFINWWPWITILALSSALVFVYFIFIRKVKNICNRYGQGFRVLESIVHWAGGFLRFAWLGKFISSIGYLIDKAVRLFARVLEGDGGFLWSFLFIVLLLSLLLTRPVP